MRNPVKKQPPENVINLASGSFPIGVLDQQTMRLVRVIAGREGTTIENVMSE